MNHVIDKKGDKKEPLPMHLNKISGAIVDAAFAVHTTLGPGLLESIYEECLIIELIERGLMVESQVLRPINYKGRWLKRRLRIDLIIEKSVVVEIKTVENILPVHEAQLITYLKLSGHRLGLIINFNSALIKDGIKRIAL
jgi:GxxExxY protein